MAIKTGIQWTQVTWHPTTGCDRISAGCRGDKGLLITTGTFAADAKKEATRDGAPPIDLIDGDRLCELLKRYDLGVRTVADCRW